jgi:hypothetical protein
MVLVVGVRIILADLRNINSAQRTAEPAVENERRSPSDLK